jgi:IS1 family transposase
MCEVNLRTVLDFGLLLGQGAINFHNAMVRDVSSPLLELDEIWSYIWKKQARVTDAENAAGFGEAYNFVGLAMPSRFVVSWECGKRDGVTCDRFVEDLRSRLVVMPAVTSDGFAPYIYSLAKHFGFSIDYAQTVKHYTKGGRRDDDHRYEPPRDPFVTKHVVFGAPDLDGATTAHVERHNGTMRHIVGRMRRLVYAFSKKLENHRAALALSYSYYNFCWIPRTMRVTPAMAAGVAEHLYDLPEFMDALLSAQPCERPTARPLVPRLPSTTARPLPNGQGFLRVVPGSSGPATPAPGQGAPPPAAPTPVAPVPASADPSGQLDLLSWRPRLPPPGTQLSLFDPMP